MKPSVRGIGTEELVEITALYPDVGEKEEGKCPEKNRQSAVINVLGATLLTNTGKTVLYGKFDPDPANWALIPIARRTMLPRHGIEISFVVIFRTGRSPDQPIRRIS